VVGSGYGPIQNTILTFAARTEVEGALSQSVSQSVSQPAKNSNESAPEFKHYRYTNLFGKRLLEK
jgi:hypothetical protein